MASVNKVILVGNLGKDPEIRHTASGAPICTVTLATSRSWKDKATGQRQEETEWHRVVFFDRLAEIASDYLRKGKSIYVEGRLKTRKWTDKEGVDKYTTEIVAVEMTMLGGREAGDPDAAGESRRQLPRPPEAAPGSAPAVKSGAKPPAPVDDWDDLDPPF